ncbi:MAG TPA: VOC family protein [Micromonosporaceae bacterium]|nr:VOC family protein [Micromonosporaceae bacterium]
MALTATMVTIDCADPTRLAAFWSQAAGYEVQWERKDEFVILGPASGTGVRIGLQRVTEAKPGKNRVHVDWTAADREAEVSRLAGLGATVLAEHGTPGTAWTVLADPEGNEFCVAEHG